MRERTGMKKPRQAHKLGARVSPLKPFVEPGWGRKVLFGVSIHEVGRRNVSLLA